MADILGQECVDFGGSYNGEADGGLCIFYDDPNSDGYKPGGGGGSGASKGESCLRNMCHFDPTPPMDVADKAFAKCELAIGVATADLYFEATDVAEGARTVKFVWKAGLRPLLTPLNTAISKYAKHLAKGAAQGAVISAAGGESPVPTTWSDFLNGAVEAATPGGSIPHQVQHVADVCGYPSGTP